MFILFKACHYVSCQSIVAEFETLAAQYGDRASFLILDQDQFPDIAKEYGVRAMPLTIYFRNGARTANYIGTNRPKIRNFIKEYAPAT